MVQKNKGIAFRGEGEFLIIFRSLLMKKLLSLALITLALLTTSWAQEEQSALYRVIGVSKRWPVNAQIAEKLMIFKYSPAAWEYVLDPSSEGAQTMVNLSGTVAVVAKNLGLGDVVSTDDNQGRDGKSPLVADMIDSWKEKVRFTVAVDVPDAATAKKAFANIDIVMAPLESSYNFLPAGGKAIVNIAADPKASDVSCKVSADGNTYDIKVPVHASFSQSRLEELLRVGKGK